MENWRCYALGQAEPRNQPGNEVETFLGSVKDQQARRKRCPTAVRDAPSLGSRTRWPASFKHNGRRRHGGHAEGVVAKYAAAMSWPDDTGGRRDRKATASTVAWLWLGRGMPEIS